jgi:NAD(P)-dependent dehydrogenase (short-subunit alcohol dehydrogenase family)
MNLLESKTIVITGGSLGIGFAVAQKCVEEGATVIIAARNKENLSNALEKLKSKSSKNHQSYSLDISNISEIRKFAEWCMNNHTKINGIVNCAGVYGPIGNIMNVDMEQFTKAININFLGTVYMCNIFAPLLKNETRKKIVNFSGGGAATPFPNYSAYATSKAAIVRLTENIAIELSEYNIDVNCIAPGFVITRLHEETLTAGIEAAGKSFYEGTKKQIESGGVPPEKAADLTTFLLSKKSDNITGKFISAPWDPWKEDSFAEELKNDKDLATLRRIDNKYFKKI